MTASARIPAPRSSTTMPVPSGSRSNRRIGKGFKISKTRKSIRPDRSVFQERGTAIKETSCPATSSMTTNDGSLIPVARTTRVEAEMPVSMTTTAARRIAKVRFGAGMMEHAAAHSKTVATEAHVPGPGLRRPMPKKVATRVAQRGADEREAATAVVGGFGSPSAESRIERSDDARSNCGFGVIRVRLAPREDSEFHPPQGSTRQLHTRHSPICRDRIIGIAHYKKGSLGPSFLRACCRWGSGGGRMNASKVRTKTSERKTDQTISATRS